LGGCEDHRKLLWVSWTTICSRREVGGLGVRRLREFNDALLGKWCWRLLVERSGLWYKVLVARYGEEDGRLEVAGRSGSSWWREIAKIRDGLGGVGGGWFQEGVSRLVGDEADTLFWHDTWLGVVPFCVHSRRLFELAVDKSTTVVHMFARGSEDGGAVWRWRRRLWVWEEEMLGVCIILLRNVCL